MVVYFFSDVVENLFHRGLNILVMFYNVLVCYNKDNKDILQETVEKKIFESVISQFKSGNCHVIKWKHMKNHLSPEKK